MESIRFEELRPDLWPAVEQLFGPNGACGGCWCMCWRTPTYKAWLNIRGAGAKRAFRNLIEEGKARGMLAFVGDEPMGWCSFGPRLDFPVLQSIEAYRRDDIGNVWSITCLFIHRKWRGKGLSRGLLKGSIEAMRRQGVRIIEGYPVITTKSGRRVSASMAWKGPLKIFDEQGFKVVQSIDALKPLVRLRLKK